MSDGVPREDAAGLHGFDSDWREPHGRIELGEGWTVEKNGSSTSADEAGHEQDVNLVYQTGAQQRTMLDTSCIGDEGANAEVSQLVGCLRQVNTIAPYDQVHEGRLAKVGKLLRGSAPRHEHDGLEPLILTREAREMREGLLRETTATVCYCHEPRPT
jgi:hypothetical protein